MTADRSYRNALPHDVACRELRANAGTQFDPAVVDAFLATIDPGDVAHRDEGAQTAVHHAAAHIRALLIQPSASLAEAASR
jgi:HD-GYP domain-containing protein (c-di-GMP phosphodiesterase class II)